MVKVYTVIFAAMSINASFAMTVVDQKTSLAQKKEETPGRVRTTLGYDHSGMVAHLSCCSCSALWSQDFNFSPYQPAEKEHITVLRAIGCRSTLLAYMQADDDERKSIIAVLKKELKKRDAKKAACSKESKKADDSNETLSGFEQIALDDLVRHCKACTCGTLSSGESMLLDTVAKENSKYDADVLKACGCRLALQQYLFSSKERVRIIEALAQLLAPKQQSGVQLNKKQ